MIEQSRNARTALLAAGLKRSDFRVREYWYRDDAGRRHSAVIVGDPSEIAGAKADFVSLEIK